LGSASRINGCNVIIGTGIAADDGGSTAIKQGLRWCLVAEADQQDQEYKITDSHSG
jgi:hypothetical protein